MFFTLEIRHYLNLVKHMQTGDNKTNWKLICNSEKSFAISNRTNKIFFSQTHTAFSNYHYRTWRKDFGYKSRWYPVKVLSLLEACFDWISVSSLHMKIQIMGGKITENLEFKSPIRKVIFFCPFFFSCSNSP